jgi:rubrerythrin
MMKKEYLKSESEAIRLALDNEIKVRSFYLEHAEQMESELGRKTFIFLADEELKHADTIREFAKAIMQKEVPDIDVGPEDEAVNKVKEFFSFSVKEAAHKAKMSKKEIQVYELGLEMELKGYNFYKKSASEAEHPNIKRLFEFLMKEEEAHYQLIQNAVNYFKDPENYFQGEEDWFFEGG